MIRLLIACVLLSVATGANAQMMNHFGMIPDFKAAYPEDRVVIVPAGETIAMPSGDIDLLWIEGVCVAPKNADLELKVREIVVAPGGVFDLGTQASPVLGNVTITFADGDFQNDPEQWGHGLLVFGDLYCCGIDRQSWAEGGEPAGVLDGDAVESVPMSTGALRVMGQVVANLTNNIVWQSENVDGTRGHCIISDDANVNIRNVSIVGMGRTKPIALGADNLTGRYPLHFHHSMGANRVVRNVVVDGVDGWSKWGIVVHASSWVTIEGCVVTRVGGSGFVTEDGSEVGNKFYGNLAYDIINPTRPDFSRSVFEGYDGNGFWLKSIANFFDDNVAIGCRHGLQTALTAPMPAGTKTPERESLLQAYQTTPGGPKDGRISRLFQTTLSGKRNKFVDNTRTGFDAWGPMGQIVDLGNPPTFFTIHPLVAEWEDCLFAYNNKFEVLHSFTDNGHLFKNCEFISEIGQNRGQVGSLSQLDYHRCVYFDGCLFDGMDIGASTGRAAIFRGNIFNTNTGIWADEITAQNWLFGLTIHNDNVFVGEAVRVLNTPLLLEEIPPCQITLDDIYASIAAFRAEIGNPDVDPNQAERDRLQTEIANVEAQIASLMITLEDLQAQLSELN